MIMKKETLEKRIKALIKQYAPRGTKFEWSRTQSWFGDFTCDYDFNKQTHKYYNYLIRISYPLASINEWKIVKRVVLHEIAHARTPGHNHDEAWRQECLAIGGDGESQYLVDEDGGDVKLPYYKWIGVCPVCGNKFYKQRLTEDDKRRMFCCDVDRKMVWLKRK